MRDGVEQRGVLRHSMKKVKIRNGCTELFRLELWDCESLRRQLNESQVILKSTLTPPTVY